MFWSKHFLMTVRKYFCWPSQMDHIFLTQKFLSTPKYFFDLPDCFEITTSSSSKNFRKKIVLSEFENLFKLLPEFHLSINLRKLNSNLKKNMSCLKKKQSHFYKFFIFNIFARSIVLRMTSWSFS